MSNSQVKNLKDLIRIYGNQKTDIEIAQLFDIPIERVTNLRNNVYNTEVHSTEDGFPQNAFDFINR